MFILDRRDLVHEKRLAEETCMLPMRAKSKKSSNIIEGVDLRIDLEREHLIAR